MYNECDCERRIQENPDTVLEDVQLVTWLYFTIHLPDNDE